MTWNIDDDFMRILKRTLKELSTPVGASLDGPNVRSWSYGYRITQGPDGEPVVKEWGTGFPDTSMIEPQGNEPLSQVDIDPSNNIVRVILDLPGVTKESIKITGTENSVRIKAMYDSKSIDHTIPIPRRVDPTIAKATYRNGVLDISLDLVEETRSEGVDIQVE